MLASLTMGKRQFDIVVPSVSVLAEPPVAVAVAAVDAVAAKHGTRAVAYAYLGFMYAPNAQDLIAQTIIGRPT